MQRERSSEGRCCFQGGAPGELARGADVELVEAVRAVLREVEDDPAVC